MTRIILILTLLLVSINMNAQSRVHLVKSGETLVEGWRAYQRAELQGFETLSRSDYTNAMRFMDYIVGVSDGIHWVQSDNNPEFCTTADVTVAQKAQVLSNYLEDNPTEWNKPAVVILWAAFRQAWPCNN